MTPSSMLIDVLVVEIPVMLIETFATAARFDLGTYPMFLASDSTFYLSVAESINDSFATILVLYAVM